MYSHKVTQEKKKKKKKNHIYMINHKKIVEMEHVTLFWGQLQPALWCGFVFPMGHLRLLDFSSRLDGCLICSLQI